MSMIVPVTESFLPYVEAAIARLRYLHPELSFSISTKGIEIRGTVAGDRALLLQEIQHTIYREKIYSETLPMRRALVDAVMRR
jgi:hypothetical protein